MTYEVSNSEIQTFRDCRRRWWLQYVRALVPLRPEVSGPLPLGSRLHRALEAHYRDDSDLLAVYTDLVRADEDAMAESGMVDEKFAGEAELGRIMLEGYLEWVADEGLDSDLEVIGVEEVLRYPVLDGAMTLIGKIDLRVVRRFSGTRAVLDFKSAASFAQHHTTAHIGTQLKTYLLLDKLTGEDGTRADTGIYRLLKKVKRTARAAPPFYEEMLVTHNDTALVNYWLNLEGVLRTMLSARTALAGGASPMVHAYPSPSSECSWKCPFAQVCPLFDDGSAAEDALSDMFTAGDPYAYYGGDAGGER